MATITSNTFLDGGVARTAGEAMAIGNGARLTIRTDSRIHANAPASFTGSLGSPTFTDIGGELYIDATAVRWMAFDSGAGTVPAIGTTVSQGGVTGYLLGVWTAATLLPVAVGATMPATGFIKFREVNGGSFSTGALTGISASATEADRVGWIELVWDAAVNFVVPRVGKITARGSDQFKIGTTNGVVGQQLLVPTTSSANTNNYLPGCWVETFPGSGQLEFWTGLSSAANMWVRTSLGFPEGFTDERGKFVKTFGGGVIQFGETATLAATYASLAAQAGTYAGIAISATYTWSGDVVTVNTGATAHLLDTGQQTGLDFTSGSGVDGIFTITVIDAYNFKATYAGSGTGGNVTVRPGVTITFTAHGLNQGEDTYCDFTSGTGVDGTYRVYSVDSANAYKVAYPHTAALTSGNVSCLHTLVVTYTAHGHAIGNEVYCDFTSGGATSGKYVMKTIATNTFNVNYPHTAAIASSNVTLRWTIGHLPIDGCAVYVSNIFMSECATGARALNTVPNATIASRPEFTTTAAGAIDLEGVTALSMRSVFAQPYSVRLVKCMLQETLDISECATAVVCTQVGIGSYSAQDARALQLTSNFAGGTLEGIWAHRPTIGTTDHATEIAYCRGFYISSLYTGIIGYARSTGKPINVVGSQSITLDTPYLLNGNIDIATSSKITLYNLDYCDRYIGKTSPTTPYYAVTVGAGCAKIMVNGVTFGRGTIPDCQPYTGLISPTGASDVTLRNCGGMYGELSTGEWAPNYAGMGVIFNSGGNNSGVKVQNVFVKKMRSAILGTVNSDKNVTFQRVMSTSPWYHSAKAVRTEAMASLNGFVKGLGTGAIPVTGQTSVYGTHWMDFFQGTAYGALVLAMNEPTAETASYFSNPSGVVKFNSSGGVEMRAVGAEAIWEMPYYMLGHFGFANIAPVMSGGTIGNYTLTYQIDKGSGWSTWKTLDAATLSAEGFSPTAGVKLRIRIVTSIANATAITFLRIATLTSASAQANGLYPLDTGTVRVDNLVAGSRVKATKVGEYDAVFVGAESGGVVQFDTDQMVPLQIEARKASAAPYYIPWQTQLTPVSGATVVATALQQLDQ